MEQFYITITFKQFAPLAGFGHYKEYTEVVGTPATTKPQELTMDVVEINNTPYMDIKHSKVADHKPGEDNFSEVESEFIIQDGDSYYYRIPLNLIINIRVN
tara:strand:+ start:1606 stop:1908 length:303 start_codon:yes stop_codon:yes gene_type:complete